MLSCPRGIAHTKRLGNSKVKLASNDYERLTTTDGAPTTNGNLSLFQPPRACEIMGGAGSEERVVASHGRAPTFNPGLVRAMHRGSKKSRGLEISPFVVVFREAAVC